MSKILYEGKTKTISEGTDRHNLIIQYKDTATAFNGEKKEEITGKGKLNFAISSLLYDYLEERGIETHRIRALDDTSVLVKKAEIIMAEVIVRNIAAGGFSKKYGIVEGTPLRNTVYEFCLKSDELGDPLMNKTQITAIGLASSDELEAMEQYACEINRFLSDLFEIAGIVLVDFKLEFGRYQGGIILCDEISPDSCRLWDKGTGNKLDKDIFRQDLGDLLEGYSLVLDRLTASLSEKKTVQQKSEVL